MTKIEQIFKLIDEEAKDRQAVLNLFDSYWSIALAVTKYCFYRLARDFNKTEELTHRPNVK